MLQRKAGVVKDRLLADTKRKTKQVERMLGHAVSLSSASKKKGREAELLARENSKVRAVAVRAGVSLPRAPDCVSQSLAGSPALTRSFTLVIGPRVVELLMVSAVRPSQELGYKSCI